MKVFFNLPKGDFMESNVNNLKSSDELGAEIMKVLGLPEHVRRFELIFEAQQPIIVKCEHMIWNSGKREFELPNLFSEYWLCKLNPNVEFRGDAPLFGAASPGTQS